MIEYLTHENLLIAAIIRSQYTKDGVEFITPDDFSQQLAYMRRPAGYSIVPHAHNKVAREILLTQEVLFIKSGRVRVDFYDQCEAYIESRVLSRGDVILLAHGGHGFVLLEDSEIIEVKQGPYSGERDKRRFKGVDDVDVKIKE